MSNIQNLQFDKYHYFSKKIQLAVSAMQEVQLLGRPECDLLLAQATVHLARAKKSHELLNALSR